MPAIAAMAVLSFPAKADLVLNATGIADGFSATTFASGFTSLGGQPFGLGPFGVTTVANGTGGTNVLVQNVGNNTLYVFNDSDGQTPGTALGTQSPVFSGSAFANLNGVAYGAEGFFGSFSSTGVFTPFNISGLPFAGLGMAADTATGELIASAASGGGLIAINPTLNTFRVINSANVDGIAISPDGQIVYGAINGNVLGYNVHTGALVFTGPIPGGGATYGPDGTAVITSSNSLNGDIIVNDNFDGHLWLIDPVAHSITLIGSNLNERGDFASPDVTNGSLFLDYTDQVARLSCGTGCAIGSTPSSPSSVPEPSSVLLIGTGLAGLMSGWFRRRSA
jgi:hypothetical protein